MEFYWTDVVRKRGSPSQRRDRQEAAVKTVLSFEHHIKLTSVQFSLPAGEPFSLVINTVSFSAIAIKTCLSLRILAISGESCLSSPCLFPLCGDPPFIIFAQEPPATLTVRAAKEFPVSHESVFVTARAFIGPKLFRFLFRTRPDYGDYNNKQHK